MPRAEVLLAAAVPALFLKDSLLMLHHGEAVLVRGFGGRWQARFGTRHWRLAGREPCLMNPFAPHAPVFRLRWDMTAAAQPDPGSSLACFAQGKAAWHWLGALVWLLWIELFVLLPLTLLTASSLAPVAVFGLLYASIAATLGLVLRWRLSLGLARRSFKMLAFECFACAPYAVNLVRRIALQKVVDDDLMAVAPRLLDKDRLTELKREALARIDEQIELADEAAPAVRRLLAVRPLYLQEPDDELA